MIASGEDFLDALPISVPRCPSRERHPISAPGDGGHPERPPEMIRRASGQVRSRARRPRLLVCLRNAVRTHVAVGQAGVGHLT